MTERLDDRLLATKHELVAVFREELGSAVQGQTRTMLFTLVGTALSFAAIMFAAVQVA